MTVKLDNANLEVKCECDCNCGISLWGSGPYDWSWDGPNGQPFDIDGEVEGLGFEDIGGKWLCPECAEKAKEKHG